MLRNTFCHLPGITLKRERELWCHGILTWDDFMDAKDLPLSKRVVDTARREMDASIEAFGSRDIGYFFESLKKESWRAFPDFRQNIAYFDIETTGANSPGFVITTICLWNGEELRHFVRGENLEDFLDEILQYDIIVSFNGKCFDVPFINRTMQYSLDTPHLDLRYIMKSLGYSGGLKAIERSLGMDRSGLADVSGFGAVLLWQHYERTGHRPALNTLLAYNALDVINLERLMIKAYNMNVTDTVFPESRRIEELTADPVPPFPVDREMVQLASGRYYA